jgi:hypothetical protein
VLGTTETKEALVKTGGSRSWVTIIDAITAAGRYLDRGIVFKEKELQAQWFLREFKKIAPWHYICSENGWTSNDIAVAWLRDVFLPQMNVLREYDDGRAILLILDSLKSYIG